MLDPNLLRNEPDAVAEKLARRGFKLDVDKLGALEERRKVLQVKTENPVSYTHLTLPTNSRV